MYMYHVCVPFLADVWSAWELRKMPSREFVAAKTPLIAAIFTILVYERSIKLYLAARGKIVMGQNDTCAPVVVRLPEHFFSAPIGLR